MRKVAIVRRFYGVDGGAQKAVERMLLALGDSDYQVTLVCESAPDSWTGPVLQIHTRGSRTARLRGFVEKAQALLAEHQFDLVQSHEWVPGADIYRLGDGLHSEWLERLQASSTTRLHRVAEWLRSKDSFHRLVCRLERECVTGRASTKFICNSQLISNSLRARYPSVQAGQVFIVRNVCPWISRRLDSKSSRPVIGFAGSGWRRKGLMLVIEALVELPNYRLVIVGKDKQHAIYRRRVAELGLSERVDFMGVVEDMRVFYSKISVLVHPALYDPFPNVTMEAIGLGIPCVVSKFTGTADFAECSFVAVSGLDPQLLAMAVRQLVVDYEQRSADAIDFASQYDSDYLCGALAAVYTN
ncbi:glycosyltransferase family 4 protein [Litorivicinus lipolyticus]|uniref:glycosyltransferase family 4 protein n=1 Tax=Litorivicinus lipolyticus TaxID=418701 RepID=UPI003B5AC8E5